MSHIVTLQTKVHDPVAIASACMRLGLAAPIEGTARLFSGEAAGLLLQFPGWAYPVVIDTLTGTLRYENFQGNWGREDELHRFMQSYAVEKARIEASKKGYTVSEQTLHDGAIKLQIIDA